MRYKIKVGDRKFIVSADNEAKAVKKLKDSAIKDFDKTLDPILRKIDNTYDLKGWDSRGNELWLFDDDPSKLKKFANDVIKAIPRATIAMQPKENAFKNMYEGKYCMLIRDSAIKDADSVDVKKYSEYGWKIESDLARECYWEAVEELAGTLKTEQDYLREIPKLGQQKFDEYTKKIRAELEKLISAGRSKTSNYSKWAVEQAKAIMKKQSNKDSASVKDKEVKMNKNYVAVGDYIWLNNEYQKITNIEWGTKYAKVYIGNKWYEFDVNKIVELKDSAINDAEPIIVEAIPYKNEMYVVLEFSWNGSKRWIVVAKENYHNEKKYTGGGSVEFSLNEAKKTADDFYTMNKLDKKYGRTEGYKRWMRGETDSEIKDEKYINTPRGRITLSEKKEEELKKEGYGYWFTAEVDGKEYRILNNGTLALAVTDEKFCPSMNDAVSLKKGDWFAFRKDRRNLYKLIDDKAQSRNGFAESLLAEHYAIDYDYATLYASDLKMKKEGTTTLRPDRLDEIMVFNSADEALKWFKMQLKVLNGIHKRR